jgi:hypothetical protein
VLPILPLTMLLTFMAGIAAFILPQFLAQIVAAPAQWLLDYIIGVARFVAGMPGASQELTLPSLIYVGILLMIFAAIIYLRIKTRHNFREDSIVE